jgi:translation initiation factor 3 subunit F
MYAFHRRNNKKEVIVGWYTTTTVNGEFIIDNSSLIHDFYSTEVENPVHLVIDTTLLGDNISARGFVVNQMVVGEDTLANTFQEAKVDLELSEAETTVLYTMIHGQDAASKWSSSEIVTTLPSSTERLENAVTDLSKVFDDVQAYVDNVVDGKIAPSREVGIAIAEALNAFATQSAQSAAQQSSVQTKVQDLLMISFLSTLTQTQTLISEKLLEVV